MLILTSLYLTATFLETMVMPRSRSRSLLSRIRSPVCSLSLKRLVKCRILSTNVVFPWSTWAIIAMFLIFCIQQCSYFEGAKIRKKIGKCNLDYCQFLAHLGESCNGLIQ